MEQKLIKIPNTKFGNIHIEVENDQMEIVAVTRNKYPVTYKGFDLWKYCHTFAIYKNGKRYIGYGENHFNENGYMKTNADITFSEVEFSKRPDRNILRNESPQTTWSHTINKGQWEMYNIATFNSDKIHTAYKLNQVKEAEKEEIRNKRLFEKYARENRATCGACERMIERWDEGNHKGVIYDHGFEVKNYGFRAGVCMSARLQPFEKSPEGKIVFINHLKQVRNGIKKQVPDIWFDKLKFAMSDYLVYASTYRQLNRDSEFYKSYSSWADENKKTVYGRHYDRQERPSFDEYLIERKIIKKVIKRPTYLQQGITDDFTLSDLEAIYNDQLNHFQNWINTEQEKVDNWELRLTPKERKDGVEL